MEICTNRKIPNIWSLTVECGLGRKILYIPVHWYQALSVSNRTNGEINLGVMELIWKNGIYYLSDSSCMTVDDVGQSKSQFDLGNISKSQPFLWKDPVTFISHKSIYLNNFEKLENCTGLIVFILYSTLYTCHLKK